MESRAAPELRFRIRSTVVLLAAPLVLLMAGCPERVETTEANNPGSRLLNAESGDLAFTNMVNTLNNLPRRVSLDLRLPVVVVDATTSLDNQTVMATLTRPPSEESGPINYLKVTTSNGRFQTLDVRPGDRVRYYLLEGASLQRLNDPSRILGESEGQMQEYLELTVAKVVDDNSLLTAEGMRGEIPAPIRTEIWRQNDDRVDEIVRLLNQYLAGSHESLAWEPSPDSIAMKQIVDDLNQWYRRSEPKSDWQMPKLLETLPKDLQVLVTEESLADPTYTLVDARYLQQSVWLRDIAEWARRDALEDLEVARQLFDWTVRNVALQASDDSLPGSSPWHILLKGRGTAEDRAWIFALLCRQAGVTAVPLEIPRRDESGTRFWCVAALSRGELYLFDPALGLPIYGQDLSTIATWSDAQNDPATLNRLNIEGFDYPFDSEDAAKAQAKLVSSPESLSIRMALIEPRLSGATRIVLTTNVDELAGQLSRDTGTTDVGLWEFPYEQIQAKQNRTRQQRREAALDFRVFALSPHLWKARVLHFAGQFDGSDGAKAHYRAARPSNAQIAQASGQLGEHEEPILLPAKQNASYWLGLLTSDEQQWRVAEDFFERRVLENSPEGPWTSAAQYNLARVHEALGNFEKARGLLLHQDSPQAHGDHLRAERLKSQLPADTQQEP